MNRISSKVLAAAALLAGLTGCLSPSAEPGGTTGSTGTVTGGSTGGGNTTGAVTGGATGGATSDGTTDGTSSGGTTTGGTSSGGGTTGGGPMCPAVCSTPHSHCDSTTNGMCVCDPGYDQCGTTCVSLASDPQHCGDCNTVCDPSLGYICINSTCVCGANGFGECEYDGGSVICTDSSVDPHNCGVCGNDCGALMCSNSSCTCNSPLYECIAANGSPYCADISSDIDNCGKCGKLCGPPNESRDQRAITWQCISTTGGPGICACNTGFFMCPDPNTNEASCVELSSDNYNCGYCNNVCDATGGYTCINSHCICGLGQFGLCPGVDGGADVCSDPTKDPHNCGFCGNDCGTRPCNNGACG